ncbi:hypothetical protein N0V90_010172 [Kalmusia sp. IMI 367209]|nr:hypothetical protein N0V90_010172 [Kalmusia sp. IMI 367209]
MSLLLEETANGLEPFKLGDAFETTIEREIEDDDSDQTSRGGDMIAAARQYVRSRRRAYQRRVKVTERGNGSCLQCVGDIKRREREEQKNLTEAAMLLSLQNDNDGRYNYEALPDSDAIRVLELQPAADYEAPLRAVLATEPRRDRARYTALSYTWSGVAASGVLHLGDVRMDIQGNLDLALRAMRLKDEVLRIWVDAVCINQQDLEEKGVQVSKMDDIYRRAESVLAWLGPASDTSEGALDYLEILAELSKSPEYDNQVRPQAAIVEMTGVSIDANLALDIRESRESASVDEILERLWFSRMWVVQEVLLARNLVLHIGGQSMPWDQFRRAIHMLWAAEKHKVVFGLEVQTGGPLRHAQGLVYARDQLQANDAGTTLFQDYTLQIYARTKDLQTWGCKDDRDRVYGILGFIPQDSGMKIVPNYTIDASEVYIEFARQHILHEGLTILLYAGLEQRKGPTLTELGQFLVDNLEPGEDVPSDDVLDKPEFLEKLPSPTWVPELHPDRINRVHRSWLPQTFNAALNLTPAVVLHKQCKHIISVRGRVFDTIEQVIPTSIALKATRIGQSQLMTYLESLIYLGIVWKEMNKRFSERGGYPTGEPPSAVFDSAVTAGRTSPKLLNAAQGQEPGWIDRMLDLVKSGAAFDLESSECKAIFRKGSSMQKSVAIFFSCLSFLFCHDQFVITEEGYMGLVPKCSEVGDRLAWVNGLQAFIVLREVSKEQYQIVGPSFLHGIMHGELSGIFSESGFIELI